MYGKTDSTSVIDMPMGALPVLKTPDGMINQSHVIARHVARKLGKSRRAVSCRLFLLPEVLSWNILAMWG